MVIVSPGRAAFWFVALAVTKLISEKSLSKTPAEAGTKIVGGVGAAEEPTRSVIEKTGPACARPASDPMTNSAAAIDVRIFPMARIYHVKPRVWKLFPIFAV